jgi:putative membrane protein
VSLKVDTAGSKGNELEIPAMERAFADELKALLNERKEAVTSVDTDAQERSEPQIESAEEQEVLVHLSLIDLIKVGLTENHLKTGFLALAFVFGTWSQYQEYAERYLSKYIDEYADEVANAGITLIAMFLVAYAIISVLISLARTILRFFDLKVDLKRSAIEISTGLFKRNQDRIPIKKIQFVEWETNPLRKLIGFESARIHPSNSAGEMSKKQRIEIPALKFDQSQLLASRVFQGFSDPEYAVSANTSAYVRFSAIVASFFILPLTATGMAFLDLSALLLLLFYVPILLLAYQFGRRVKIGINSTYLAIKKGWIFPLRIVLPAYKMQSVAFQQNVFLKRRKLAHLKFYTAAGSRSVRYLSEEDAFNLYNYLLYKVESHTGDWM